MSNRHVVEGVPIKLPLGDELVHQGDKAGLMGRLEKVNHLVHHDVFQALRGLLRQFGIKN